MASKNASLPLRVCFAPLGLPSFSFAPRPLCPPCAPSAANQLCFATKGRREAQRPYLAPQPSNRGGLEDSSSNYKHSRSALRSGWGALSIRRSVSAAHLPTLGVLHNKKQNTHSTFEHSNIRTFLISCRQLSKINLSSVAPQGVGGSRVPALAPVQAGRPPSHFLIFSLSHFLILIFPHSHITFRRSRTKH